MKGCLLLPLLFLSLFALTFSGFTPLAHAAGQPPINTSTLWVGELGWGPVDADPAVAYDCFSQELIFNSYEGLITWNREQYWNFIPLLATNVPTRVDHTLTLFNTSAVGSDPTGSTWSSGYTCVGWVDELGDGFGVDDAVFMTDGASWRTMQVESMTGTSTITLGLWYGSYTFNLRTSPTIYFYNYTGGVQDTFDANDAEYSFERALVLHASGGPIWMLTKPLFDLSDYAYFTNDTAIDLAHLIDDAIVGNAGVNTLSINIGVPFQDASFKQILSNTWAGIISKEYVVSLGGWKGDLYETSTYGGPFPDWWIDWSNQGAGINYATQDPIDAMVPESFCGTGPYHLETIDPVNLKVIMQRNPSYWRGWPANYSGHLSNGYLDTVELDYIASWATRKAAFLAGAIDIIEVPRCYLYELVNPVTKEPEDLSKKTIKNIVPVFGGESVEFIFSISNKSTHVGTGQFPAGIPLDFFNNTHTRRAFAYSLNWSNYIQQECYGEADYRKNFLPLGLYLDYYNNSVPGYYESLQNAEAELKAAIFNGTSVWDSGFTLDITFNTGNDMRRVACSMIRSFFTTLSTYDGRVGPPFVVNVVEIDWPTTIKEMTRRTLAIFAMGWYADFADANDFAHVYMHSKGRFAFFEDYTADNGWGSEKDILVDAAFLTPDGPARQALFDQLAIIYYNDCPSFPYATIRGRMWLGYWVKGWYYNPLYPALYYYPLWKADDCWYDVSGPTSGISDGSCSMRDIAYLIAHFNAKAPIPGVPVDPKWVEAYGANGGVDPYGDRLCSMKDIAGAIQHFNHKQNTNTP